MREELFLDPECCLLWRKTPTDLLKYSLGTTGPAIMCLIKCKIHNHSDEFLHVWGMWLQHEPLEEAHFDSSHSKDRFRRKKPVDPLRFTTCMRSLIIGAMCFSLCTALFADLIWAHILT